MYTPNLLEAKAIGEGKHLKSTGIIKKVFLNKADAYGFLLLLTPLELRGRETSFFCSDVKVPESEREHLRVGMQLEFKLIDKPLDNMKSPVPYKALELSPLTPSYYQAAVVRAPGETGKLLRVAIDLTLEPVKITPSSYLALKTDKHLSLGDPCVIQLTWKEMVNATREKRTLVGDIVSACRLRIPLGSAHEGMDMETEEALREASSEHSPPGKLKHDLPVGGSPAKKVREPPYRARPAVETAPELLNPYEADYRCNGLKQDHRYCSAPCCQDLSFVAPSVAPFAFPNFSAPCACPGCLIMRQKYSMIPSGCMSCYPMDVEARSWPNVGGC